MLQGELIQSTSATSSAHRERVERIARELRGRAANRESVHIEKGGVHHFVPLPRDQRFRTPKVDVSSLKNILSIDPIAMECVAEPGITFAELVRETLKVGLLPMVVPELEGITLGGAVAGCSVESMSYKYGGFHDSCREYEFITGDGRVLSCSPSMDADVFHMLHGSYGTLGILSSIKFRLIPAKPYVQMEYRRHRTFEAFNIDMRDRCNTGDYDFVDGIVFGKNELVLCLGRFVDKAPWVSSYRRENIFYKSTRGQATDYLTTFDYCFRYDTECHWLTRTVPPLEWKPVRYAVASRFLGSTNLIRWSNRLAPILSLKRRPDVVVDVFIPSRRFEAFFSWYAQDYGFWPLWIVPYRIPTMYPWVNPAFATKMQDDLFIDCAVYGKANNKRDVDYSRVLEDKTYELGGIKTLISRNHYSEERFWEIYNRPGYEAVKNRLDPGGTFLDLFRKFHRVE